MKTQLSRPLKVFLCHSSEDKPTVRALYKLLVGNGVNAWLDEEKILPGQDWNTEIMSAVQASDAIIVCLSRKSISKEGYVQKELSFALNIAMEKPEGTIFIIPLLLEECKVPKRLRNLQYVNISFYEGTFSEKGYSMLLQALGNRALQIEAKPPKKVPQNQAGNHIHDEEVVHYNTPLLIRAYLGAFVCFGSDGFLRVNTKPDGGTMEFEIASPLEPLSVSQKQPIQYNDEISIRTPGDLNFISLEQYSRGFWKEPIYFGHTQMFNLKFVPEKMTIPTTKVKTSYKIPSKNSKSVIRYGEYFMVMYADSISVVAGYGNDTSATYGIVWLDRKAVYGNRHTQFPEDQPSPYNLFSFVKKRER